MIQPLLTTLNSEQFVIEENANITPLHTVIVPAFNEEDAIGVVLSDLYEILDDSFEVIVVDDGSTDATVEIASQFLCQIISLSPNQGKATAVKAGADAARGLNIILIDADDTYPCEAILQIAESLEEYDVVVASRRRGRDNIPRFNRIGNQIFCSLLCYLYNYGPKDPLTGLYGIRKSKLDQMTLDASGFGIETELAINVGRMGLNVLDIPIRYRSRIGEAKLHSFTAGLRIFHTIVKALALFSPTAFFVLPGVFLMAIAAILMSLQLVGPSNTNFLGFSSNTFIVSAMMSLAGFQTIVFGIGLDLYASTHRFAKPGPLTRLFFRRRLSGVFLKLGFLLLVPGVGLGSWLGFGWLLTGRGEFHETRLLMSALMLIVVGMQLIFSSSFLSVFVSALGRTFSAERREALGI